MSDSGPFTLIKFALNSFATAFLANRLFLNPGGPHSNRRHAARMPKALNESGLPIAVLVA